MSRLCDPCSRSGRYNGPAAYLWHDERGWIWPLCWSCMSLWLLYSCEDEPGSTPKFSIDVLPGTVFAT